MASLQARHQKRCPLPQWTTFDNAVEGCQCRPSPTYYAIHRELNPPTTRLGLNRKEASRAFLQIQAAIVGHSYRPLSPVGVEAFQRKWMGELDGVVEGTEKTYRSSAQYAGQYFRGRLMHLVTPADLIPYNVWLRDELELLSSTRHKHFATNKTMWNSAIARGHASRNPFVDLPRSEWPKKERRESPYFLNEELPLIFGVMPQSKLRDVCTAAHVTGARLGEVLGLETPDFDSDRGLIHVRRSYDQPTKTQRQREVMLNDEGILFFRDLVSRTAPGMFFPSESEKSPYLTHTKVEQFLYEAMERAGVKRLGPTGQDRVFHSFRHTYAKKALEAGVPITWLKDQLGHSSITVTVDRYGHWERDAKMRVAQALSGLFVVTTS